MLRLYSGFMAPVKPVDNLASLHPLRLAMPVSRAQRAQERDSGRAQEETMAAIDSSIGARPDGAALDTNGHLIRVGPRAELDGVTVVSGGRHGIAVFPSSVSEAVYAIDNRCPHMGFPLHKGSVADGILTCHWHHARFDLESGGTFDPWADDVQTYPTVIEDGIVYVDARPHGDNRVAHAKARLWDGLEQNLNLVVVKNVLALLEANVPPAEILAIGGRFGATYRRGRRGAGLTALTPRGNHPALRSIPSQRAKFRLRPIACKDGSVASSTSAMPMAPSVRS